MSRLGFGAVSACCLLALGLAGCAILPAIPLLVGAVAGEHLKKIRARAV